MTMDRREALKRSGLLMGVALSASALAALMQSCSNSERLSWMPRFFAEDEAQTVAAIVDQILPTTETPGGLDLQVDMFVDLMMSDSLLESDQKHVKTGMQDFMKSCRLEHGKDFHQLSSESQVEILKQLGEDTNTFNVAVWGSPIGDQAPIDFYRRIRQFALIGYFSSETIGTEVLAYDPIPGEYNACTPLQDGQKLWTL